MQQRIPAVKCLQLTGGPEPVSGFIPRETTSPTPTSQNRQLGTDITAHKTWKAGVDFKKTKEKRMILFK